VDHEHRPQVRQPPQWGLHRLAERLRNDRERSDRASSGRNSVLRAAFGRNRCCALAAAILAASPVALSRRRGENLTRSLSPEER